MMTAQDDVGKLVARAADDLTSAVVALNEANVLFTVLERMSDLGDPAEAFLLVQIGAELTAITESAPRRRKPISSLRRAMDKRIATHGAALHTGHDVASCALEGFQRLENLLKAISCFADLAGARDLATLAKEAALVAVSYADLADSDAEQFQTGAQEIGHG